MLSILAGHVLRLNRPTICSSTACHARGPQDESEHPWLVGA